MPEIQFQQRLAQKSLFSFDIHKSSRPLAVLPLYYIKEEEEGAP